MSFKNGRVNAFVEALAASDEYLNVAGVENGVELLDDAVAQAFEELEVKVYESAIAVLRDPSAVTNISTMMSDPVDQMAREDATVVAVHLARMWTAQTWSRFENTETGYLELLRDLFARRRKLFQAICDNDFAAIAAMTFPASSEAKTQVFHPNEDPEAASAAAEAFALSDEELKQVTGVSHQVDVD